MKKIQLLFFILSISLLSVSQNLILNSSFEEYKKCPKGIKNNRLRLKKGIKSLRGAPNYFHTCSQELKPKTNPFGKQNPADGKAYCGLTLTSDYSDECSNRDYIQLKLKTPLEAGNKYLFKMKISLADTSGYYTDQIGIHFYKSSFSKKQSVRALLGKASINNIADTFLNNSEKWVELSGVYNAKGEEQYLMIGNFQKCRQTSRKAVLPNGMSDSLKKYENKNPHRGYKPSETILDNMKRKLKEDLSGSTLKAYNLAYYFIDDLSLTPFQLNESISYLTKQEACSLNYDSLSGKNLINDGSFSLNKENENPYWETASEGTPDFLKNKVGLYLYSDLGLNNREYIITKSKKQLTPCKSYYFKASIKRNSAYKFAVDQFQLAAVDSSFFSENRMIFPFQPLFSSPSNYIIEEAENWIELCGVFTPSSCSNYIILGNFSNDEKTYILPVEFSGKNGPYAYYYIDNVKLYELDSLDECEDNCLDNFVIKDKTPEPIPNQIPKDSLMFYFKSSSTFSLGNISRGIFNQFFQVLEKDTSLHLVIEGHADASGNEEKNILLSKERGSNIYSYLLQIGFIKSQLKLSYYGSSRPQVPNTSKKTRAKNRRVVVYLSHK